MLLVPHLRSAAALEDTCYTWGSPPILGTCHSASLNGLLVWRRVLSMAMLSLDEPGIYRSQEQSATNEGQELADKYPVFLTLQGNYSAVCSQKDWTLCVQTVTCSLIHSLSPFLFPCLTLPPLTCVCWNHLPNKLLAPRLLSQGLVKGDPSLGDHAWDMVIKEHNRLLSMIDSRGICWVTNPTAKQIHWDAGSLLHLFL